ncbi:MAG: transcriptional regulator [Thermoplasmata archaeon]|jgi:predicted transcriptional regulator|nr:transcriptional regulator [Thermoplasmata archaeon]MVT13505.1 transcriptional regulator [Euryarchaeota archaeon]MVT14558.1 transcriptional regulator [Euryarchaeota archaeon]MVT35402.1 transcriptional regulator [Euryarchaeota archaeon]
MENTYSFIEDLMEELNLLERHLKILKLLEKEGPVGIMRISQMTDIPPHRVRYSLRILETERMITATPEGAKIIGDLNSFYKNINLKMNEILKKIEELKKMLEPSK